MRKWINVLEQALADETIDVHNAAVSLKKNLSVSSLCDFLEECGGAVRALVVADDIYYWKAYDAIHTHMAKALGITPTSSITLTFKGNRNKAVIDQCGVDGSKIAHVPAIVRLLNDPSVCIETREGQVSGEKFLQVVYGRK